MRSETPYHTPLETSHQMRLEMRLEMRSETRSEMRSEMRSETRSETCSEMPYHTPLEMRRLDRPLETPHQTHLETSQSLSQSLSPQSPPYSPYMPSPASTLSQSLPGSPLEDQPPPCNKDSQTLKRKRTKKNPGGFEDPGPAACPRKSIRTKKRRRTDTYDYVDNTRSRFTAGNVAAEPSKDVLVDLTTQLARISFGTKTTVGHVDYSSWVSNLKAIMEGTLDNVKDLAVSSLVNIACRCDLASKVDGTARFVRILNKLYFAAKVNRSAF
ncbi:hypothetical protein C8J55DRAFT_490492 [Lentinula edodes]|uniref:Uncharacterized protein n=1 Tax=Lentinula lateritia TaxID=40482 RepID=A0A9W9A7G7_9AGAR|nr:hypothetical protein C8J55DRAFT_490492 [Lentinula edodes]